jgi:hypothetical protein
MLLIKPKKSRSKSVVSNKASAKGSSKSKSGKRARSESPSKSLKSTQSGSDNILNPIALLNAYYVRLILFQVQSRTKINFNLQLKFF